MWARGCASFRCWRSVDNTSHPWAGLRPQSQVRYCAQLGKLKRTSERGLTDLEFYVLFCPRVRIVSSTQRHLTRSCQKKNCNTSFYWSSFTHEVTFENGEIWIRSDLIWIDFGCIRQANSIWIGSNLTRMRWPNFNQPRSDLNQAVPETNLTQLKSDPIWQRASLIQIRSDLPWIKLGCSKIRYNPTWTRSWIWNLNMYNISSHLTWIMFHFFPIRSDPF